MGMNQQQIEKLRSASLQFAEAFKAEAKLACLEHMQEFQANVKEAMAELETKINQLIPHRPKSFDIKETVENKLDNPKKTADN
jgi:hypothetical protein